MVRRQDFSFCTCKKMGRPRSGKRSNSEWVGRTFYVKADTDSSLTDLVEQLKELGIQIDKSELAELILSDWLDLPLTQQLESLKTKFQR